MSRFPRSAAVAALAVAAVPGAPAHESPATAMYLDYELREDALVATIEAAGHHFEPLAGLDPAALPGETGALERAFVRFVAANAPVSIDGTVREPELVSFDLQPLEDEVLPGRPETLVLALTQVRYPIGDVLPEEIVVDWRILPKLPPGFARADFETTGHISLDEVVMSYRVGDGPPDFFAFTPETPRFVWRPTEPSPVLELIDPGRPDLAALQFAHYVPDREVVVPVVSAVLSVLGAGALFWLPGGVRWRFRWRAAFALAAVAFLLRHEFTHGVSLPAGRVADTLDDSQARALFAALHRNIYTAFDYETEDEIYDVLSQSVAGELLDRIYTEVYQSLILEEADGAAATVQKVNLLGSEIRRPAGGDRVAIGAHWKVEGVVAHNNHVHLRINEYRADYAMEPVEGLWKITEAEQRSADRVFAQEAPTVADPALFPEE